MVVMPYGSLAWGVLPIQPRTSWETHLAAAVIGVLAAFALRRLDVPPRKRYEWEDEPPPEEDPPWWRDAEDGGRRP
jgi:membrane associated rhomboid family serine protease